MEFTPGHVIWTELMTQDPKAAAAYYAKTAGWKIEEVDIGMGPYHVAHAGEAPVAGIMGMPEGMEDVPPYWLSYIGVTDVDAVAAEAVEMGATLIQAPFDVPGVGRMVILNDPLGAQIAYMTPSEAM